MLGDVVLGFNPQKATTMYLDVNSCFATVEQQYNPEWRGRNVAVVPYVYDKSFIIAASIEAKRVGIKTGMLVRDAKAIDPHLIVVQADPPKYRKNFNLLHTLLKDYSSQVSPRSIDEFAIPLKNHPAEKIDPYELNLQIKKRITKEVGDWIRVSIGFGPNCFLAKTAVGLYKPDGFAVIDHTNYEEIFKRLGVTDLCGISRGNGLRLASVDIFNAWEFYQADYIKLKQAFHSVTAYDWFLNLRGWEPESRTTTTKKSFSNSYALPIKHSEAKDLAPILYKLVSKTCVRLRSENFKCKSVGINLLFMDGTVWHEHKTLEKPLFDTRDVYKVAYRLLLKNPNKKPVRILAEVCSDLVENKYNQLDLFEDCIKKTQLNTQIDTINTKWGSDTLTYGGMLSAKDSAPDRIAFGK